MRQPVEKELVAARKIAVVALAVFVIIVLSLVFLGWLSRIYRVDREVTATPYAIPDPPRIDPAPQTEYQRYREEKSARLHGFGWVDRPLGIVYIPIDTAMALYARRSQGKMP